MSRTPAVSASAPQYTIYSLSDMEPLDTLELHVLARAYRAAWRSRHARDPVYRHVIAGLDVIIDFGASPDRYLPPSPGPE
jgi:hypothetical protein